ncbi:hypothetical protein LshimejAT787_0200200 [Lyophyllum shimeji]|uniref:Uncharacterized protein n=1 Tax=Lyophyllum shimeji TaxID=47721 RepID=A0A9P3PEH3_LYOSH|nr:hypothetical protein LshimejAT787_0200200 [Lyophyllum shimeji]
MSGEMVELAGEVMTATKTSLEDLVWSNLNYPRRGDDVVAPIIKLDLRGMQKLRSLDLQLWPYRYHCQWATRILRDWRLPTALEIVACTLESSHFEIWPEFISVDEPPYATRTLVLRFGRSGSSFSFPFPDDSNVDVRMVESYIGKWFPRVKETGYLEGSLRTVLVVLGGVHENLGHCHR